MRNPPWENWERTEHFKKWFRDAHVPRKNDNGEWYDIIYGDKYIPEDNRVLEQLGLTITIKTRDNGINPARVIHSCTCEDNTIIKTLYDLIRGYGIYNLSYADLSGCDLSGCDLSCVDFTGSDLTGCDLTYAKLDHAVFTNSKLLNVNFRHTGLSENDLLNVNKDGSIFGGHEEEEEDCN